MRTLTELQEVMRSGLVIPASPLALNAARKLDERRQRALWRYYSAAGAGGIAVGVHTTQFAIRKPEIGLYEPLLSLAAEELNRLDAQRAAPIVRIAGVCGKTGQAVTEAALASGLGYEAGLLSLGAMREATEPELIAHCKAVSEAIPLIGFYLQPAVGGRVLSSSFWRGFMEIERVAAIKIAPFNRYQTLDVLLAYRDSGRRDIALYTGNDDAIVADLITPLSVANHPPIWIEGGLLGHWSVWTLKAVELLKQCRSARSNPELLPTLLQESLYVTDTNAAFFDSANGFAGCIAGLHEVLRRQGLLEGIWCLDPHEGLSPGQKEEIDRVYAAYPHLNDDSFVAANRDSWLSG
jgi:dihydrodipicolinate synthase/N-acetylneuraminate lyase